MCTLSVPIFWGVPWICTSALRIYVLVSLPPALMTGGGGVIFPYFLGPTTPR
ncbi:hypothetical protein K523DRAFT_321589 [Schizophyllum commune Tattone D]|nr:hypothetical protein K523DRAFT_321589 [Schizophyllum commune Tattone D]